MSKYYVILEEKYMPDKWKVLVCCILLNRTKKDQAESVIEELFEKYPTAEDMAKARVTSIRKIIKSLGFQNVRSETLKKFSKAVLEVGISKSTISELPGIGFYGKDCYMIMFEGAKRVHSRDYALLKYVRHMKRKRK